MRIIPFVHIRFSFPVNCQIISHCALNYSDYSALALVACLVNVSEAEPLILAVSYCENVYAVVRLIIAREVKPVPLKVVELGIFVL